MWNLELSAAIQAERTREVERRNREWRLLHPEPVSGPVSDTPARIQPQPAPRRRAASSGSA